MGKCARHHASTHGPQVPASSAAFQPVAQPTHCNQSQQRKLSGREGRSRRQGTPRDLARVCLCHYAGHKKQHRPKAKVKASAIGSTAAASASPAAPAPTPAPAELLGDALATLTLQPQAPKPPAPLAPPTAGSSTPCKASVAPDSASAHTEPGSEWEQVQGLHDSQGVGYLAAFTQVAPDLRKQADTGARGAALAAAAHRLCQAVQQHATHTSTDAAVAVLKAALKECKTSSAPHSQATLVIKYNLAQLLTDAQLYEAAAHTWLWVLPRAGRLPREAGYDQCQARLSTLQCLTGMGHYLEGLQLANDACGLCLESRGKEHPDTMRALKYLLVCHEMSVPLPPLTLLPLLQTYVAYLRRTNKGGVNDRELWERLRRLHCCQKELNDLQGATASSRELMQVARRCYGVQHERYFEVRDMARTLTY